MLDRRYVLGALAAGIASLACHAASADEARLKVVASFSILGDMVHEIAGDRIELTVLVGPNGDAHVYEPSPADAQAVAAADVVVVNGLHFEGWLPRLVEATGFNGRLVTASEGVVPRHWDGEGEEHAEDEHASGLDPHAWQDLTNGLTYVDNITRALAAADPGHAADYQQRGAAYRATLTALDRKVRDMFAAIPAAQRRVVTSHDAFGYFGQAYHLDFVAPQGMSTEAEPSAGDVARIIEQIRAEHIPAVFMENISDPRMLEQISRETGARIGGELFSDALSPPDGPAPTYVRMFEHNAETLTAALRGS